MLQYIEVNYEEKEKQQQKRNISFKKLALFSSHSIVVVKPAFTHHLLYSHSIFTLAKWLYLI